MPNWGGVRGEFGKRPHFFRFFFCAPFPKIMKALFYPSGRFTMLWKRRKRNNKQEGIKYFDWISSKMCASKRRGNTPKREMKEKEINESEKVNDREKMKREMLTGRKLLRLILFGPWTSGPSRSGRKRSTKFCPVALFAENWVFRSPFYSGSSSWTFL